MTKKFNFCLKNFGHSHEIIDCAYAYHQSQSKNFDSTVQFQVSASFDNAHDVNVYLDYMPNQTENHEHFDLVLYSNGCEPLTVSTTTIAQDLAKDKYYLICNSLLTEDHPCAEKVIWFPANLLVCKDLWTRYFMPHFFHNAGLTSTQRTNSIIFVNGCNRSWRHHVLTLLAAQNSSIKIHSTISSVVHETLDSQFESEHDAGFRHEINQRYAAMIVRNQQTSYYDTLPRCGINNKFGSWPPGYTIMPLYYQNGVVVFPESTWQNNEVAITEKIMKCWFSGSIPWPVGGSKINQLYNTLGFGTAWNLLPEKFQNYDDEQDHFVRYEKMVSAIAWLERNQHALQSESASKIRESNRARFLAGCPDIISTCVQKFNRVLSSAVQ